MKSIITIIPKLLVIGFLSLVMVANAHAQRVISGTVTAAGDGEPLVGVNVAIQGTVIGTTTDLNGGYLLEVSASDQLLVFSMVGFQTYETIVGTRSTINVALVEFVGELDEVVVTAFGLERERRSLGYAVQTVRSRDFTEARETNPINNLRGRIAGVEISQSPTAGGSSGILLRGVGSITGDNMPLVVVDGVPIDNQQFQSPGVSFGGIDYGDGIGGVRADDIEEISVLKGPNASALYGARASNGVLLITTKSGRVREGVGVEYNSNITFDRLGTKPTFQNKYAPGYGYFWEDAYSTIEGPDGQQYPVYTGGIDSHGPPLDGRLIIIQRRQDLGPVPATPQPRDNVYQFFDMGITASNSIALSGGDATTTYRISFSDERNQGVVPQSEFSSNSVSLRVTSSLTDRLRVDGRANYYRHEGTNRPELGAQLAGNVFLNAILMPRFVDFDWLKDYKTPAGDPINVASRYPSNPYWLINERQNEDSRDRVYGFISANYMFTDWLSLNVRAGTDTYYDQRFRRAALQDPGYRDGFVENRSIRVVENNYDALLSANRTLSPDFTGSISVGGNFLSRRSEETGSSGTQLSIPGLYHINNANSVNQFYSLSRSEMQSVYALGQIGFRNFVYLDLSARNDWSSTLGQDHYSFFYPSASMAFVFTDALNIQSSVLSDGRLRVSYAETGNDTWPYRTKAGYNLSSLTYDGVRLITVPGTIPLLDLKNELTKSWEIGADLVFFQNRLSIDIAAYSASTYNQIFSVPVSTATGYNSRLINAGQIDNKGVEVSVNASPVRTPSFVWNLGLNFARNRNQVVELAEGVDTYTLASGGGVTLQARPGEPFGDLWGFAPMRLEDGTLVLNELGRRIREAQPSVIGNMQPDFTGGIVNEFSFRGFTLGAVMDFRVGGDVVSLTKREGLMKGTGIHTEERAAEMYIDGVIGVFDDDGNLVDTRPNDQPVDPVGYYPTMAWSNMAYFWLVDGTYLSLNELTLGYNFSPSFIARTPFTALRASLVARNVAYLILDDDLRDMGVPALSNNSRNPGSMAYEENNFPLVRTFGININMQF